MPRFEKHSTVSWVCGHEQLLDEVLVLDCRRRLAAAAATLRLVFGERLRLRVAGMRERHHDVLRLDQVLGGQIQMIAVDLGAARVAVLLADLDQLVAHHLRQPLGPRQDVAEIADALRAAPCTRR